ncbi:hypothetical protein QM012_009500 [Aureobasidium pullulans]|uniref:Uncharacterized protein n=1 Tax=Aureobasidium pullulans TaxID=5580 RepID=A0ABR0THK6_AURPU
MKNTTAPLLPAKINNRVPTHQVSCRRYLSLSVQNLTGPTPAEPSAVAEQQTTNLFSAENGIRAAGSSDRTHSAISMEHPSPCTLYSGTRSVAVHTFPHDHPSNSSGEFSPDLWTMSPEEHSLMTNSASFARGRRRRGVPVSSVAVPTEGRLSRLRRLFSRDRQADSQASGGC